MLAVFMVRYLGPTTHRGSRWSARMLPNGRRVIRPFDYGAPDWGLGRVIAAAAEGWQVREWRAECASPRHTRYIIAAELAR